MDQVQQQDQALIRVNRPPLSGRPLQSQSRWLPRCLSHHPGRLMPAGALTLLILLTAMPVQALNLLETYQLALQHDPQWQARLQGYLAEQQNEALAQGALRPAIGISAAVSRVHQRPDNFPVTIDSNNRQIGLQGRLPLLDAMAYANWQRARAATSLYDAQLLSDQQQFILRIAQAYFDTLRAQDTLELLANEEKTLARQQDAMNQRYLAGLIARTDIIESAAQYQAATANRVAAEAQVASAREQLSALTGMPVQRLAILRTDASYLSPQLGLDEWLDQAQRYNPAILTAQLSQQVAEQGVQVQAAAGLPQLALTGGVSTSRQSFSVPGQPAGGSGYQVGLELNWPLYQGGRITTATRQARFQADAARHQLEAARRQTVAQTRASFLNVQADQARLYARSQAVKSAAQVAEATRVGYEVGTRNIVDVLLAQRNAYVTRRDLLNTRYDHILNYLNLQAAAGWLDGSAIRRVNQLLSAQQAVLADPATLRSLPREVVPPPQVSPAEAQRILRQAGRR